MERDANSVRTSKLDRILMREVAARARDPSATSLCQAILKEAEWRKQNVPNYITSLHIVPRLPLLIILRIGTTS